MKLYDARPFSFCALGATKRGMATLQELVSGPDQRTAIIRDALTVLDAEVADKGGLGGLAIKAAFKVVKGVSPDFLYSVIDALMDDFLKVLEPFHQEALATNTSHKAVLSKNPGNVADALLAITDARAKRAKNAVVAKTYDKLRGSAKGHVEAAVPRLAELIERHAG